MGLLVSKHLGCIEMLTLAPPIKKGTEENTREDKRRKRMRRRRKGSRREKTRKRKEGCCVWVMRQVFVKEKRREKGGEGRRELEREERGEEGEEKI